MKDDSNSRSALHLPGGKKGNRILKQLTKPQRDKRLNDETPADMIDKILRKLDSIDKRLKVVEAQSVETFADLKNRQNKNRTM